MTLTYRYDTLADLAAILAALVATGVSFKATNDFHDTVVTVTFTGGF